MSMELIFYSPKIYTLLEWVEIGFFLFQKLLPICVWIPFVSYPPSQSLVMCLDIYIAHLGWGLECQWMSMELLFDSPKVCRLLDWVEIRFIYSKNCCQWIQCVSYLHLPFKPHYIILCNKHTHTHTHTHISHKFKSNI